MRKLVLFAALALVTLSCGSGSSTQTSGPIKIGVTMPLSGDLAAQGQDLVNAAKLAAVDINNKGGVLGRKIEIDAQDDQCDSQVGTQAAEKLVLDGVVGIVGALCSGAGIPESAVLDTHGHLPFVAAVASNPLLTERGLTNVFRMFSRDDNQGPIDASYLYDFLGVRKLAIMHDNTTYPKGMAEYTRAGFVKLGGQVVYLDALTAGQQDYRSVLTKVASFHPDALDYPGYYPEINLLIKQYNSMGLKFKLFFGGGGGVDPEIIKVAGAAAENPSVSMTTPPTGDLLTGTDTYKSAFNAMFHVAAGTDGPYEYDGVTAMVEAIRSAGSTDPAAVVKALHQVHFTGLTGDVVFDAKGDRPGFNYVAVHIQGGKYVVIARVQGNKWTAVGS